MDDSNITCIIYVINIAKSWIFLYLGCYYHQAQLTSNENTAKALYKFFKIWLEVQEPPISVRKILEPWYCLVKRLTWIWPVFFKILLTHD